MMTIDYILQSNKQCKSCKWLRYHREIRALQLTELKMFNPQAVLGAQAFMDKYAIPLPYPVFARHLRNHIIMAKNKPQEPMVLVTNKPVEKLLEVLAPNVNEHEQALDSFIAQFDEAVRSRQIKMTAKDGLQAIKIKADIENRNKDRSKDVFKMMMGADGGSTNSSGKE